MYELLLSVVETCHTWLTTNVVDDATAREIICGTIIVLAVASALGLGALARHLGCGLRGLARLGMRPFSDAHLPMTPLVAQVVEWLSCGAARIRDGVVMDPVNLTVMTGSACRFDEHLARARDKKSDENSMARSQLFRVTMRTRNGDLISVFPYAVDNCPIVIVSNSYIEQPSGATRVTEGVSLDAGYLNRREERLLRSSAAKLVERAAANMADTEARAIRERCQVVYERLVRKT